MSEEKYFRFGPIALTTTMTTNLLNPPASSGGTNYGTTGYVIVLDHISIVNKTASPVTFSLWLGATNANAAGTEVVGQALSVPANDRHEWHGILKIHRADFLVGGASSNTALSIMGQGRIVSIPTSAPLVELPATLEAVSVTATPATATSSIFLNSPGGGWTIDGNVVESPADTGVYLLQGVIGDYEARMTVNSGAFTTGTINTWLDLAGVHSWSCVSSGVGIVVVDATLQIRDKATSIVRATANVLLSSEEVV